MLSLALAIAIRMVCLVCCLSDNHLACRTLVECVKPAAVVVAGTETD